MVSYKLKLVERDVIYPKLSNIDFDENIIEIREDLSKRTKAYLISRNKILLKNKEDNKIYSYLKANLISAIYHPSGFARACFRIYLK